MKIVIEDYMYDKTLDDLEANVFEHEIVEKVYTVLKSSKLPGRKENTNAERDAEIFYERTFLYYTFEEIGEIHNLSGNRCAQIFNRCRRICYFALGGTYDSEN